jgi:hypothetical protein
MRGEHFDDGLNFRSRELSRGSLEETVRVLKTIQATKDLGWVSKRGSAGGA